MSGNSSKLPQVSLVFKRGKYYLRTNGARDTAVSAAAFKQYLAEHPEYELVKKEILLDYDGSHRVRIRPVKED